MGKINGRVIPVCTIFGTAVPKDTKGENIRANWRRNEIKEHHKY